MTHAHRFAVLVLAVFTACAAHIDEPWFDADGLRQAAKLQHPEGAKRVELDVHERLWVSDAGNVRRWRRFTHRATLVLEPQPDGKWSRAVTSPTLLRTDDRVRALLPDGTARELPVSEGMASGAVWGHKDWTYTWTLEQLPPGTIMEVIEGSGADHTTTNFSGQLTERAPIQHRRQEIWVEKSLSSTLTAYNAALAIATEPSDDGYVHFAIEATALAGDAEEDWPLGAQLREPSWLLRLTARLANREILLAAHDWDRMLPAWNPAFARPDPPVLAVDPTPVDAQKPLIPQLFAHVRDGWHTSGFELADKTPPELLVQTDRATAAQKAAILHARLTAAGIPVQWAGTTRFGTTRFEPTQPSSFALNHLILYVPETNGPGQWLDPACEMCEAGELPYWLAGAHAVTAVADPLNPGAVRTQILPVTGKLRLDGLSQDRTAVRIDADGLAHAALRRELTGAAALFDLHQKPPATATERDKNAKDHARDMHERAELDQPTELRCDAPAAKCARDMVFHVEKYATVTADRLVVPMRLLGGLLDKLFQKDAPRHGPVLIERPWNHRQTLAIQLPPGYALAEPPADVDVQEGPFRATCHAGKDGDAWTWTREIALPQQIVPVAQFAGLRKVVRAFAACREAIAVAHKVP